MIQKISHCFSLTHHAFEKKGIFDAIIGIDTNLFLDPFLLANTKIPEFKQSRKRVKNYYADIVRLLLASKHKDDSAWREAQRRLKFKELPGVSIGYGVHSSNGNAIGSVLGDRLLGTAAEIVSMGIRDPELFELLGLFEEDFGADRLSDMTIAIIKNDLFGYSERMAKVLRIKDLVEVGSDNRTYVLPRHPDGKSKFLVFIPQALLRDLPVAYSPDSIGHVVATNAALRRRLNEMIGKIWRGTARLPKSIIRDLVLGDPKNIKELIKYYKIQNATGYDFDADVAGELSWYDNGKKYADEYPLSLSMQNKPTIEEIQAVIDKIIGQFKKNIEVNGLNELLYSEDGPKHERYSQRLFYSVSDSYCQANNIDLNREPNAGSGPVDFKYSQGYVRRILVEIKLSSNKRLLHGYKKQLPAYENSESTKRSIYVVIKVTRSDNNIKQLLRYRDECIKSAKRVPVIHIIDAALKPSASRR